jgi:hypothetical protein
MAAMAAARGESDAESYAAMAAMAAARGATSYAAGYAARAARYVARDAQKTKLVQILTAGVWVDDDSAGKGGEHD